MKRPPGIPIEPTAVDALHRSRFTAKVRVESDVDCHTWMGATNNGGYGVFRLNGRQVYAHRLAWTIARDIELAVDLTIDHLCRNRSCVNPAHLEAVTSGENTRRQPNAFHLRTSCPKGHPYAGDNLYRFPDGRRACRTCMREAQRRHQQRKAASA